MGKEISLVPLDMFRFHITYKDDSIESKFVSGINKYATDIEGATAQFRETHKDCRIIGILISDEK